MTDASGMLPLVLTSDGLSSEPIRSHLLARYGGSLRGVQAAIVTTASEEWKEKNRNAVRSKATLDAMQAETTFFDFDCDDVQRLASFDLIYISGGNPFHLLKSTRESGAHRALQAARERGCRLVGASAGALLLGPNLRLIQAIDAASNQENLTNLECLAFHDLYLLPHAARYTKERAGLAEAVQRFEKGQGVSVARLDDGQALVVLGASVERIGVCR